MLASPPVADGIPASSRITSAWLWLCGAVLVICSVVFVVMTRHWPMVGDATLMRYTVFLIQHGWAPYRDFVDINMPGTYLTTAFGMHLATSVDVSWRIFDLGLIALAGVGYSMIARPYSWFAALFATTMLLLVHGQDGVQQAGQRDLVIAVLLILAVAFLLEAVRRERWFYLLPFGLAVGLSATIKPTAGPLGVVLLVMAAIFRTRGQRSDSDATRRRVTPASGTGDARGRLAGVLSWTAVGIAAMAAPVAGMFLWLWHKGAFASWIMTERVLLPSYAMQERRPFAFTLSHSISPLLPLVLLWLFCVVLCAARLGTPSWPRFERLMLATGAMLNLVALLAQGKALPYQRYPMLAFLLLLMALDLTAAWRTRGVMRAVAWAGLSCGSLVLAPLALIKVHRFVANPQEFDAMLTADLRNLHAGDLSGRVQCLDTIQDCLATLYTLRLLPATGTLGDVSLFGLSGAAAADMSRRRFLHEVETKPPLVFVVVSGLFLDGASGYRKLDAWPTFEQWLNANYTLEVERTPSQPVRWWSRPQPTAGYRLYIWKAASAIWKPPAAAEEAPLH